MDLVNQVQQSQPMSLLYTALMLWAVYLSFERNKGFDLGSFILAVLFAPIYIVYFYATSK